MLTKDQIWAANGQPKTNSLFKETCRPEDKPLLSLNGITNDYPCLKNLYVQYVVDDPSEALFAETVFGDIHYWIRLKQAAFMPKFLEEWNEIVEIKRKQKAFQAVFKEIEENGRSSFSAAKYLIEEGWRKDSRTKAAKEKATSTAKKALTPFEEDLIRLNESGILQ